jgi:hypothetical protein
LKCCQSSPSKSWPSLSPENKAKRSSSSKTLTSPSNLPAMSSLQWTPATLAVHNCPTTWKPSSEQWQWWSPITPWLHKFLFILLASATPETCLERSPQLTLCALNSCPPKTITITVWEPSNPCWLPPVTWSVNSHNKTKQSSCYVPSTMSIWPSSWHSISHFSEVSQVTCSQVLLFHKLTTRICTNALRLNSSNLISRRMSTF